MPRPVGRSLEWLLCPTPPPRPFHPISLPPYSAAPTLAVRGEETPPGCRACLVVMQRCPKNPAAVGGGGGGRASPHGAPPGSRFSQPQLAADGHTGRGRVPPCWRGAGLDATRHAGPPDQQERVPLNVRPTLHPRRPRLSERRGGEMAGVACANPLPPPTGGWTVPTLPCLAAPPTRRPPPMHPPGVTSGPRGVGGRSGGWSPPLARAGGWGPFLA